MLFQPEGSTFNNHSYKFDGTQKNSARHTIAVTGLKPWSYYVAILEGCSADACSESVNTTFVTPFQGTPWLRITRVESTSPSSFEIAWRFESSDSRLYEGFRVQFCTGSHEGGTCFVTHTREQKFTAQELEPSTTYYIGVSPRYRTSQGALWLGPPARASIETWGHVPVLTVSQQGSIDDGFGTSLLAWTCVNSSVSHLQYQLDGQGDWTTCNDSADCDVTVEHASTAALAKGFLRLTHHRENGNVNVAIRGCNGHGCGLEMRVNLNTHNAAYFRTPVVTVTWQEGDAHMECDEPPHGYHRGLEILWKCGAGAGIYRKQRLQGNNNYYNNYYPYPHQDRCTTQIYGLPEGAQDCELSVARYEQSDERTYYGPPVQVPLA